MKIPEWVPQVSRPFNPAYREVWDVMTPNERRASFLFDAFVVAIVFIALGAVEAFK